MIVVDTSAVIAILMNEPCKFTFVEALAHTPGHMSAVSLQEAGMIMRSRRGPEGLADLYELIAVLRIFIELFDETQARAAVDAFSRYGKGMGSAAKLNFGDCASYALAKCFDMPLLFRGDDFFATDICPATASCR